MALDERTYAVFTSEPANVQTGTPQSIYAICLADAINRGLTETQFQERFGTSVQWVNVQNKDGAISLYLQDIDNIANANVEILAGESREYPMSGTKHFIKDYYVKVGTNGQVFSIEIKFG